MHLSLLPIVIAAAETNSRYRKGGSCKFRCGQFEFKFALSTRSLRLSWHCFNLMRGISNRFLAIPSPGFCWTSLLIMLLEQKEASKALERAITLASRQTLWCIRSSSLCRSPQASRLHAAHRLHPKSTKVCSQRARDQGNCHATLDQG